MDYTTFGKTGMRVSKLCLGTWRFGKVSDGVEETSRREALNILDRCHEEGLNFIDTADVYGDPSGKAEKWIGSWLSDVDRDRYVIATKVYAPFSDHPTDEGLSRKRIRRQVNGSLDRLGTNYVDILYLHRWDDHTDVTEVLSTLDSLVASGKVHQVGITKTAAWRLAKALWKSEVNGYEPLTVGQPYYNAVRRDEFSEYLRVCADQNIPVCPLAPLDSGFLTGKYERTEAPPANSRADLVEPFDPSEYGDERWETLEEIRRIADANGATPAQVALRWLIEHELVDCVPIVGVRTTEQLDENLGAVEIKLSDEEFKRIGDEY